MKFTDLIADNILQVYEGNNWTEVSMAGTINDVTVKEAMVQTHASRNSIAAIVHHLQFWNDIIIQRLQGLSPEIPAANGFDLGVLASEDEWQQLIEKTHQSFIALADTVKHFPEDQLADRTADGKSTYHKIMQGIVEHAYYHLGQIVILKHIVKEQN